MLQGASNPGNTVQPIEKDLYYYHPDHLGSTGYVTDRRGQLTEHVQYFPFGESWIEQRQGADRTPYLFTGKELDEVRRGFITSGRVTMIRGPRCGRVRIRYLAAIMRVTPTVVFASKNLGLYSYGSNNPIRYLDPDGNASLDSFFKGVLDGVGGFVASDVGVPDQPQYASQIPSEDAGSYGAGYILGFESTRAADDYQQNPIRGSRAPHFGKVHIAQPPIPEKPTQRAATREAKRALGIPTSQQAESQTSGRAADGTKVGRQQTFKVPKAGGGEESKSVQVSRDIRGKHAGIPQIEAGTVKLGGQVDSSGRPSIQPEGKVRVDFDPNK